MFSHITQLEFSDKLTCHWNDSVYSGGDGLWEGKLWCGFNKKSSAWKHKIMCWADTSETLSSVYLKEKCCKFYTMVNPLSTYALALPAVDAGNDAWNWACLDSERGLREAFPDFPHRQGTTADRWAVKILSNCWMPEPHLPWRQQKHIYSRDCFFPDSAPLFPTPPLLFNCERKSGRGGWRMWVISLHPSPSPRHTHTHQRSS